MAKAANPKPAKAAKKEPVDKAVVTALVAAHINSEGKMKVPIQTFIDLAREIDQAIAADQDEPAEVEE